MVGAGFTEAEIFHFPELPDSLTRQSSDCMIDSPIALRVTPSDQSHVPGTQSLPFSHKVLVVDTGREVFRDRAVHENSIPAPELDVLYCVIYG